MAQHRIDTDSLTWLAVKAWAESQLAVLRRLNDTPGLPMPETENARGSIRHLNLLLGLPEQQRKDENVPNSNVQQYASLI